jgi:hypothetical protein
VPGDADDSGSWPVAQPHGQRVLVPVLPSAAASAWPRQGLAITRLRIQGAVTVVGVPREAPVSGHRHKKARRGRIQGLDWQLGHL